MNCSPSEHHDRLLSISFIKHWFRYAARHRVPRWLSPAHPHPRTHNIPVALLHLRSFHPPLLNLFMHFALHAASAFGIPFSQPAALPTQRTLWTVPRSPFIFKKSQENFDRKTHKRVIKLWDADMVVVRLWIQYLEANAMGGVGMKFVTWDRVPVGVGQAIQAQTSSNTVTDRDKVRRLAEKIVGAEMGGVSVEEPPPLSLPTS